MLRDQIRAALALDIPEESIARLKRSVATELRLLNVNARVIDTHYFNHSFTPDFVLRWDRQGIRRNERPVYLRFESERDYYEEDLSIVGDQDPILLGLELGVDQTYPAQLDESAIEQSALIISSNAVEHLTRQEPRDPFVRLFSSSLGEGGRGAVDEQRAEVTVAAAASTFDSAQRADALGLVENLETVSSVLSDAKSNQLSSFLEALWVGSGGSSTGFPRRLGMSGRLTDEQWQFLLDFEDVTDHSFWRHLGIGLGLEQLGRLHASAFSTNLQALVAANWDRLTPRIARVLRDQARLDAQDVPSYYWEIVRGMLCLRGPDASTYVAIDRDSMKVEAEQKDGPSVDQLLERQERTALDVVEVLFAGSGRTLDFTAEEGILSADEIAEKGGIMGSTGRVKKASVRLPDDRKLTLDFTTSTAGGLQAMHPLKALVIAAYGFLADATGDDLSQIESLLPDIQRRLFLQSAWVAPRLPLGPDDSDS